MKVIILDTETTGLTIPSNVPLDRQPKIIELAAILVDSKTGKVLRKIEQLIDPEENITEEITKITGITDKDVEGKPTFKEFLPSLVKFFKGADALIAHNAEFDTSMIRFELARLNAEDFSMPGLVICTVIEFRNFLGYNPKLTNAYEHFTGEKLKQTHRAMDDVNALLRCCQLSGLLNALS